MAKKIDELSFSDKCKQYLEDQWRSMLMYRTDGGSDEPLKKAPASLRQAIFDCLKSKTKTYRYVLPTQILCKCVDSSLDCRSLQAAFRSAGAFDARSVAHEVIVPFDRENHQVLGGSPEPYVSNPLRCDSVTRQHRAKQKNKVEWDKLVSVLGKVQRANDPALTRRIFDQVLFIMFDMLDEVKVTYPVPNRVSLDRTLSIMTNFLAVKSGGDRLEGLATALFRVVGRRFKIFDDIRRERVNVADASSGMAADIECRQGGKIVLMVEVKDRVLSLVPMDSKLALARSRKINEIMFMAQGGIEPSEHEMVEARITREFASGQNIYVVRLEDFAKGILTILGESGRVDYLHEVGDELDRATSPIPHRKAWAALLQEA
jgi:hypothetical protein